MQSIYKILINPKFIKALLLFAITINFISCNQEAHHKKELSKLKNEKSDIIATIDYKSIGCFGGETGNLKIINTDREMRAILTLNKAKYATTLDTNKIQAYNKFIKELKTLDFDIGCTTTSFYAVKIGNEKIEKKDGGCSWDGFNTLKYALFNQEIQERLFSYE